MQNTIDHLVLAPGLCPSSTDVTSAVYWVIYVRASCTALSVHLHANLAVENILLKSTWYDRLGVRCHHVFKKQFLSEDPPDDLRMTHYV